MDIRTFYYKALMKFGTDKILHFFVGCSVCALIAILVYFFATELTFSRWLTSCIVGSLVTFLVAYAKEMIDWKFDHKDLKASMLGTLPVWFVFIVGTLIGLI